MWRWIGKIGAGAGIILIYAIGDVVFLHVSGNFHEVSAAWAMDQTWERMEPELDLNGS